MFNSFGITDGMINGSSATIKNGTVLKNGDVIVDGKVIATGAITAGRHNIGNSTPFTAGGSKFYKRPTTISFVTRDVFEAYVFVDSNGKFLGAVLKPCGNPATATPKPIPPTPAKKPLNTACISLKATRIEHNEYIFEAKALAENGAMITGYSFRFHGPSPIDPITINSSNRQVTTDSVIFDEAGSYTATATVHTSIGDRSGANCSTRVIIRPESPPVKPIARIKVCDPSNGQIITVNEDQADNYKPVDDSACQPQVKADTHKPLPSTGPPSALTSLVGLGSLTALSYYYHDSRSQLRKRIKQDN